MTPKRKLKTLWWAGLGGALLAVLTGQVLLLRTGNALARLSYDVPFLFLNHVPDDLVMVYIDRAAKVNLGESSDDPLPRRYHARLLERLKADGARLVFYDLLFESETADDAEFADAIRNSKRVVLVTAPSSSQQSGRQEIVGTIQITRLAPGLAEAAAGVGLAIVDPDPQDAVVRSLYPGFDVHPSAAVVVATNLLGRPLFDSRGAQNRQLWLNYYGCPLDLREVNFDHALDTNGLPAGFFRNRIVVVGIRDNPADQFQSPHRLRGELPAPGSAIQAISALNLLNGDWLTRLSYAWELGLVVLCGALLGAGLSWFRPWNAAALAVAAALGLTGVSVWTQAHWRVWWPWAVPAFGQSSIALLWSIGWQYLVEARRRKKLRQAFGLYLSPYMADRIADSEFDLALGGQEAEATVMFTDLEGFTKMSETLAPAEVSGILTTYFNQTTRAILEQDGTIIKYIGDAVLAVWGVPLADANHAERAVLAAWGMSQAGKEEIAGRRLRTRIGINTGKVLAGNLGSDFRFDYTLIGDAVNFASRLEGLNKYLGTDILVSETTRAGLSDRICVRCLGRFLVVGKKKTVAVYEVMGPASAQPPPRWLDLFARALDCFAKRELDEAERNFREVLEARQGKDGPSEFYLGLIETARRHGPSDSKWDGVVRLTEK